MKKGRSQETYTNTNIYITTCLSMHCMYLRAQIISHLPIDVIVFIILHFQASQYIYIYIYIYIYTKHTIFFSLSIIMTLSIAFSSLLHVQASIQIIFLNTLLFASMHVWSWCRLACLRKKINLLSFSEEYFNW
jgi:hypothetical protein